MAGQDERLSENAADIVDTWVERSIRVQASDMHFEPDEEGLGIKMRIDGILHTVKHVDHQLAKQIIARVMVMAGLHTHKMKTPQEGRADFASEKTGDKTVNMRVSTFPTVWGTRAVVRFFTGVQKVMQLHELGYNEQVLQCLQQFACQSQGIVLLAGPAGSGKTTSVYALMRHIKELRAGTSVISIEDPVENSVEGITQVPIGAEGGGLTYQQALKSLLRQDPQVVAIGEIRDSETAGAVLEASLTGHLLISTVHSPTVAGVVMRLLDMGLPSYQLASGLTGVVAQRLVRRLCTHCRVETGREDEPFMAAGCVKCLKTGYRGRVPVAEAGYLKPKVRKAIVESPDILNLQKALREEGFHSLKEDAERLVRAGITTRSQVLEILNAL